MIPLLRRHHTRIHWALTLLILLVLALNFLGGLWTGYHAHDAIQRFLGGKKDSTAVINAHYVHLDPRVVRLVGGGRDVDLSYLMPPPQNQGATNACGSFSLTEILYALRVQRGEKPLTYFSPWYHRYNVVGNSDAYTTMQQNIDAVYQPNGGMIYHWRQESPGQPSADEVAHADAKSAYYSVFSLGGNGTFDQIAYEIQTGHPVWILNTVRDGMESEQLYTDNAGNSHGSHFEVAVGVAGGYLKILNSWGNGYYYMSRYGIDTTTREAAIVSIGSSVVWPAAAPVVAPTAAPTVTTKPTPTATPRPRVTPRAGYIQVIPQALRSLPAASSSRGVVVRAGWRLKQGPKADTPHFAYLCLLTVRHCGWDLKANIRSAQHPSKEPLMKKTIRVLLYALAAALFALPSFAQAAPAARAGRTWEGSPVVVADGIAPVVRPI